MTFKRITLTAVLRTDFGKGARKKNRSQKSGRKVMRILQISHNGVLGLGESNRAIKVHVHC